MKKLLVLMLVLAMSSLVSAGLILDVVDNQVAVVMEPGTPNLFIYDIEVRIDAGELVGAGANINPSGKTWMTAPKIASQSGQAFRVTAIDIQMFGAEGLAAPNQVLSGLVVSGASEYTVTLFSYDCSLGDGSNELGVLDTVYVPEPMSLMLLGLGGLFLRRRK